MFIMFTCTNRCRSTEGMPHQCCLTSKAAGSKDTRLSYRTARFFKSCGVLPTISSPRLISSHSHACICYPFLLQLHVQIGNFLTKEHYSLSSNHSDFTASSQTCSVSQRTTLIYLKPLQSHPALPEAARVRPALFNFGTCTLQRSVKSTLDH